VCVFICFSRYQIFTDVTKEQYFSSNFSLAYEYALAGILGVDYNLELYRTTSYTFVSNRIETTVEVFCDEDNNVSRYYALFNNNKLETFPKVMFKKLHYPVLVYTVLNYPNVKKASESPRSFTLGLFKANQKSTIFSESCNITLIDISCLSFYSNISIPLLVIVCVFHYAMIS
jgi:hypothetical protein